MPNWRSDKVRCSGGANIGGCAKSALAKNSGHGQGGNMVSGDWTVFPPWGLHGGLYSGHQMDTSSTGQQW